MKKQIIKFLIKYRFYSLTGGGLLIWVSYFDGSSLWAQIQLRAKLSDLKSQQEYYDSELRKVRLEENEVMGTKEAMEKFAREKYLMKKNGETIFIIVDEENKSVDKEEDE